MARRSTRARAASTLPRSRRRSAGTTGWSSTRAPGRERVEQRYMLVPTTCFNCESACGLLAYVDRDTLQVRKFEGNPEHPGSRGRNCAKGPATHQPGHRSRPDPVSAQARGRPRRGPLGAGELGRGARRHRRPDPARDRRGPPERGHVPRGPAGRGRLHRAGAGRVGRRRPQLAHQHLLERRPGGLPLVDGARPAEPRPRARARDPADLRRTSRPGTTSTRTPSA